MGSSLILFTPGPVRVPPLVSEWLADPPVNYHRQEGFRQMFGETQEALKALVGIRRPDDWFATHITATGTGANEASLLALSGLGRGMILSNGFFGARLVDQAVQNQLDHLVIEGASDRPLDVAAVAAALDANPDLTWCFFVSHETRMGLRNPLEEIGRLCKARGLLVGADVVSSAYAYPIDLEAAEVDLAVTSSAKAIMSVPGLGIVFTRLAALPRLAAHRPRSYYLDLVAECERQRAERQPRFAQPVALHAALAAACRHLRQVGIESHFSRIRRQMDELIAHLGALGVMPLLEPAHRSGIAVNFGLPPGLPYREFARRMEASGHYVLYGIPGDQSHFQVSTIGDLSDAHIAGLKAALTEIFADDQSRAKWRLGA